MTVGDLLDKLRAIEGAENDLKAALQAIYHGGSPETIANKGQTYLDCEAFIQFLREEKL